MNFFRRVAASFRSTSVTAPFSAPSILLLLPTSFPVPPGFRHLNVHVQLDFRQSPLCHLVHFSGLNIPVRAGTRVDATSFACTHKGISFRFMLYFFDCRFSCVPTLCAEFPQHANARSATVVIIYISRRWTLITSSPCVAVTSQLVRRAAA